MKRILLRRKNWIASRRKPVRLTVQDIELNGLMLKRKIHSLENDLGIYSDEITEIVDKNVQGLKSGRDDIVRLAELLNKQADEVLLLCSL